ncbi:MAG: integrase [Chloroflexi bacterium]|nr:MAG: integrase [Chloroflexota bacterium]
MRSFELFRQYLERRYSAHTTAAYLSDLSDFKKWFEETNGEAFDPSAVTSIDVREYRRYLLNRKAKPATINRRLAALSTFFRWAKAEGLAKENPTGDVRGVQATRLAPRWLSRKEQLALLRAVHKRGKARDIAIITLLLHTGLRVSEACSLRLADLKLNKRKGELRVRGKGLKERVVPLNAEVRKALRDYLAVRPAVEHDFVFVGQRGEPLTPSGIQRLVKGYACRAGLEDCTPHVLRHTFAKNLVDSGVPLDRVAALLGHENLNTTRIYTAPSLQDLMEAVERLVK